MSARRGMILGAFGFLVLASSLFLGSSGKSWGVPTPPSASVEPLALTVTQSVTITSADNPYHFINASLYPVPRGKRLVLEHVSFKSETPNLEVVDPVASIPQVTLQAVTAAVAVQHEVQVQNAGQLPGNRHFFVGSHPIRLYSDAGTSVALSVKLTRTTSTPTTWSATVSVSGYLEDVPKN